MVFELEWFFKFERSLSDFIRTVKNIKFWFSVDDWTGGVEG